MEAFETADVRTRFESSPIADDLPSGSSSVVVVVCDVDIVALVCLA